jgi:DNA-binding response OmpR family regulator
MSDLVLIVDDDECVANNIQAYLEDEGYQVCTAGSGEQGLRLLQQCEPAFAIVDMRLPGMNGNEFIQQASVRYSKLQFLIHTGSIEYTLPDLLRKNKRVRQSVFFKPVVKMASLVREMCS